MRETIKYFSLVLFIASMSCEQNTSGNEMNQRLEKRESNNELKMILEDYCGYLKTQDISGLDELRVILMFSDSKPTLLTVYVSRYPPTFYDTNYCYFGHFQYDLHDVLIVKEAEMDFGKVDFSLFENFERLDCSYSDKRLPPPYTDPVFDNSIWEYHIDEGVYKVSRKYSR